MRFGMSAHNKKQKKERFIPTDYSMGRFSLSIPAAVYVALMMGVFPLFVTNKYINIIQSKRFFFEVISVMTIMTVIMIIIFSRTLKLFLKDVKERIPKAQRICLALLLVGVIISTCASDNVNNSIFAQNGRRYGALFIILCMCMYIYVGMYFKPQKWVIYLIMFINCFMAIIIIADNWKFDLLGMKTNLAKNQYSLFTGTMGNININASYFSIIIPIVLGVFYAANTARRTYLGICSYIISMILMFYASLCIRSDSLVWCLFLAVCIIISHCIFYGDTNIYYIRTCIIAFLYAMSYTFMGVVYRASEEDSYKFSDTALVFSTGKGMYVLWFIALLMTILALYKLKNESFTLKKRAKPLFIGLLLFLAITSISIIFVNIFIEDTSILFVKKLIVSDSFGTNRGYIWKRTINMIKKEGIIRFITGYGLNRFYVPLFNQYYDEMSKMFSAPFIDAHNEILQMLITTGIFGTLGYIGLMISSLIRGLRKCKQYPIFIVEVAVISSYLLQGMVNNPQVFTLPLIFVFMGCMQGMMNSFEDKNAKESKKKGIRFRVGYKNENN